MGLIIISLVNLKAQSNSDLRIKADFEETSLDIVLLELKINYKIQFNYEKSLINEVYISDSFRKLPLDQAMARLLEGTAIDFEITDYKKIRLFERKIQEVTIWEGGNPTRFDFTLSGKIKDKKTGETLPFANVLLDQGVGVNTNVDGHFSLFNVPNDTMVLTVSYLGYQPLKYRITPETNINNVVILMEDFGVLLKEVEVKAIEEEQMISASTGVSRVGITPAALAELPSYGEKDIFRSLQLLPGISGSNESSSGLYVRGGTPDQNLVLFDGFTVYHVDHLFGFFSAFNANAVKDVQLYKGGFDAKYGGRISSVVDLTGKDGNTEQFNTGFGLSLLSVNGFIESPFADGKGSFLISGRRSFQSSFYSNIFEAYTNSNSSASENQTPGRRFAQQEVQPNTYFYDLNAKVSYRLNSKDLLSLSFYNGEDNLDNSRNVDQSAFANRFGGSSSNLNFNRESTDLTAWGNWGTSAKWSRKWSDRFYSNTNLSYSNYYSERDRTNNTTIVREDSTIIRNNGSLEYNDLKDISLKIDNEFKLTAKNQLDFGIQSTWNNIEYKFTQNDTTTVLNREDQGLTTSFYLQDKHTFGNKLILKGGIRNTHYSPTNKLYFEPRAGLTFILSDKIKAKAAWGKYYQFANRIVREDIQQGSRDFWLLADDESVPISSAYHHIAGLSYETNTWLFDVEGYYKTLDGLSEYSTRFVPSGFGPNRTISYEEFFHNGTGVAKGIEFLLQKKVGKLTGWLGYTLGEVKYDFEAFGDEPFYANQDVTNELKLVGNYKLGKWSLGGTFIYATGKPYTGPTGYYELTLLDGTTSDFFEVSEKNALRFDDYHRLDLSATYNFNLGRSKASAGMTITNVYNRNNTWYKEFEVIEGELLETNVSLIGFTPSLFFTWSLH